MDLLDGANGFVGRDVIFRPIEFERYRKPCIVSYPRHATVLNPQHTKELRSLMRQSDGNGFNGEDVKSKGSLSFPLSSSKDGSEADEDIDDDDPLFMEHNMMLCCDEQLRQSLQLRWKQVGPSGCGLQNMGNTCFVNCVLQAIAHTPALAHYFTTTFKAPCSNVPGAPCDYAYALGETIRKIHGTSKGAYRPGLILSNMKLLSPHFRLGRQCDAHEFAVQMLHACHKAILFRQVGSKKMSLRVEQTNTLQRIIGGYLRSCVSWSGNEEVDRLKIAGKVQESIDLRMKLKSKDSKKGDVLASNTFDPFIILNVEIAGHHLNHCLAKFCEKERIDGRSYHSPRGVGVRATKHLEIHKPPNVFVIHIKRFNASGGKISKFVQYPKVLNLAPYCSKEGLEKAVGRQNLEDGEPKLLYELNALCVHEGGTLNYGHYYSVARARNGAWLLFNDERVSHCSEEQALRQQAYMLFYSKIEVSSHKKAMHSEKASLAKLNEKTLSTNAHQLQRETNLDLGRELTNEELDKITKERMFQKQNSSVGETAKGVAENGFRQKHLNGSMNGNHLHTNGEIVRDAHAANNCTNGAMNGCTVKEKLSEQLPRKRHPQDMYKGIIKCVKRQTLEPKTAHAEQLVSDEGKGAVSVTGVDAVAVVEDMKGRSVPTTVARPLHAPQFRQRVRDPLWEEEMDRGRVKRVRIKAEEYNGENKFQNTELEFDRRGRRVKRPSS